jgi:hypothetical protein
MPHKSLYQQITIYNWSLFIIIIIIIIIVVGYSKLSEFNFKLHTYFYK